MEIYLSIFVFCFVTSITPGPNTVMLMTSGLNHGIRKTLPHLLGICMGFPVMFAAIALGLGAVFLQFPIIHLVIKIFGIAYLLFFAWKIANTGNVKAERKLREPLTFLQAVAFQWINPKAWAISVGAIATYTTMDNYDIQILLIIIGYMTIGSLCMIIWLSLGASLQKLLRSQKQLQYFNICMAFFLAISVISMAMTEIGIAI